MRIGVVFPQTEIGTDPAGIREYALAAEATGYTHLLAYDHVIGADTRNRPEWNGSYTLQSTFHELFVLFGYLAGIVELELVSGVIILPQRQTVLVAKQAAEIDVLTGGRFRLGAGLGWNAVEYETLNENFHNRGKRSEEQIEVLQRLFTEESVTYHGKWHHIDAAGINPMPVQRPIPIWLGGSTEQTLRRVACLAAGWLPNRPLDDSMRRMLEQLRAFVAEAGRDPASIGIEARVSIARGGADDWTRSVEAWQDAGATHLSVNTMGAGLSGPKDHIAAIQEFARATGL